MPTESERRDLQQLLLAEEQGISNLADAYEDFERMIGLKVRQLRVERAWSQDDLAARMTGLGLAMHQTTVAKLEAARRPIRAAEVYALATVFGLPLEALWYVRVPTEPMAVAQMRDELQGTDEAIRGAEARIEEALKIWMEHRGRRHDIAEAMDAAAVRRQVQEEIANE